MECTEDDAIHSIWEEAQKEVSYENQLEQQKVLLLTRKEIEDWKRIVYGTERFRKQYLSEERYARKKEKELYKHLERLSEPHLDVIIAQNLEKWIKEDGKPIDYQAEIERMRAKINRMNQRVLAYEQSYEQIQKSKSHQMVKEVSRKVKLEERKIEERQAEINDFWKARRTEANEEWEKEKKVYVGISELYTEFGQMEMSHEATLQNNEIKRAKIVQLYEEIKLAKIEQEEETKRREIELSERLLIPGRIQHMTFGETVFKDPNDFPILIDKIESTRKSYEQMFKRPGYMDFRKMRKNNRKNLNKSSAQFALLFGGIKRKNKSRRTATQSMVSSNVSQSNEKTVTTKLSVSEQIKPEQTIVSVRNSVPLSRPEPDAVPLNRDIPQGVIPEVSKSKSVDNIETKVVEEHQKPVCNVQGQQVKQTSTEPMSQPVVLAENIENPMPNEESRKRPSFDTCLPASAPPCVEDTPKKPRKIQQVPLEPNRNTKPNKVSEQNREIEPKDSPFEFNSDSFSFSPEKPSHKTKTTHHEQRTYPAPSNTKSQATTETMDFEPDPHQKTIDDDNFSFGSASPPPGDSRQSKDDCDFLDSVSLSGGSISSFDMEDRESGSDLGFDLSPVGSRSNNRKPGGCGASNEDDSDFDFLASPPKSGGQSGRKGRDSFDLMDTDDSGTGFDFF
ncbi:uncharacterized protein LOC134219313 [Armigeres subalbatus]|uniref:uncharacterized protein LOC134219313 n=1 Tax=Armigeres subalbatus TaxID=124917 RepID=UPI002ED396F4